MEYKFDLSIIIPTLGRKAEVRSLIRTIYASDIVPKYSAEIIVVDQNFSDLLDEIVAECDNSRIPVTHCKVSFRGLSKAKNYGASIANGRYLCFLDDDAEVHQDTISRALERLSHGDYDIVSGRCVDREGNNSVLKFAGKEAVLSKEAFENRFVESTMFFKHEICSKYQYDENMGLGAFYGAEEGFDIVYRMLCNGVKILYDPQIKFYHPQTVLSHSAPGMARRAFSYRVGFGYVCKKHKFYKRYYKRLLSVMLYIPYLSIVRPKDAKYYVGELLGLLVGYSL
jgi:glycosyltransferase involved in cell wall biosynthesis